jgi:hypothetical protein
VIFIDKFNVSGIEMVVLDEAVQEIASWSAVYWRGCVSEGPS